MEPESPSPYPQLPATCSYPEPNPSSPHAPPPPNFLKIHLLSSHLRLGLPNGLFPSGFHSTFLTDYKYLYIVFRYITSKPTKF
jgi:hypothetical protein